MTDCPEPLPWWAPLAIMGWAVLVGFAAMAHDAWKARR